MEAKRRKITVSGNDTKFHFRGGLPYKIEEINGLRSFR